MRVHQRLLWIRWLKSISLQLCVYLQQASMQVEALRNGDDDGKNEESPQSEKKLSCSRIKRYGT